MDFDVPCHCGECTEENTFECEECHRIVPWCFGADDNYFELCDSCAIKHIEVDEQLQKELDKAKNKYKLHSD